MVQKGSSRRHVAHAQVDAPRGSSAAAAATAGGAAPEATEARPDPNLLGDWTLVYASTVGGDGGDAARLRPASAQRGANLFARLLQVRYGGDCGPGFGILGFRVWGGMQLGTCLTPGEACKWAVTVVLAVDLKLAWFRFELGSQFGFGFRFGVQFVPMRPANAGSSGPVCPRLNLKPWLWVRCGLESGFGLGRSWVWV
eukprot:365915-Chlamydomonas_euryale.AAC.5